VQLIRPEIRPAQHVVGPGQRDVTEQDGGGRAEPFRRARPSSRTVPGREIDVRRRRTASGGGIVHQVVVHQGAGVDQFQRAHRL
jgi:hypothetical protein